MFKGANSPRQSLVFAKLRLQSAENGRKQRGHEKTLLPIEILPKTVEKATRKDATHDGNLDLKKGPGELGGRSMLGYYVLQESVFWIWFLHRFLHVGG